MEKRKLSAREILQDIRDGLSDSELMQKYELSENSLRVAFRKLVEGGSLTKSELDMRESLLRKKEPQFDEKAGQPMPHPEIKTTEARPETGVVGPEVTQEQATTQPQVTSGYKPNHSDAPQPLVCPKCGKEYHDASTEFCPKDGFRLIPKGLGKHCPKCGCATEDKTDYCGKCGTRLFHNWDYSNEPQYYREKFDQFERNRGSFKATWNWAAFCFGCLWYLVKGMWGKAIVLFSLVVALVAVTAGIAIPFLWVYGGVFGNYDYYLLKKKHTQWWG